MTKGRTYPDSIFRYEDPESGREIVRLTDYLGHSNHLYFTDPCWIEDNESLIFTSDRENQSNLFRYDLSDHAIRQLTDLKGAGRPGGCFSQVNGAHYFWWHGDLIELDVETLAERVIAREPEGMTARGRANPTADGRYVCTCLMKTPEEKGSQISYSYSRFREFYHAQPFTQIVRVDVETGEVDVIHEDHCYIGHINTSPMLPEVMTFCHEGPWDLVEQRIWGLNIQTGDVWKIRDQTGENVAIGHEYWFADGERIGYHGRPREGEGDHIFGWIRWDNSEHREVRFPFHSTHFHSLDETLIVGDGTPAFVFTSDSPARPYIQLFKWDGERYVGPRVLAYHRSTFNNQHAHPHPRFTPDGKAVLYSSDLTSYSNIYLAEVGDFEALPPLR
jgi:oligogalacturonide lyase